MTIEQRPSLSIALPKSYLFTSESVTEGHPDKMCDQISDAILDAIISKEIELEREGYIAPSGQPADVSRMRCACETLATTGLVAVAGEIRTQAYVDVPAIVREVVCGIGYDRAKYGFDGTTCGVVNAIHEQSPDIAQGVDESWEAAHGGAFSGKDCTKVDRSAAYAARWVAKNVVAAGLAARCEVQVAYAIGVARPVSLMVETFGTEKAAVGAIERAVAEVFDLRPGAIIDALDLRRPIYRKTAAYGHFGRELPEFTWERTDRAEDLRKTCRLA